MRKLRLSLVFVGILAIGLFVAGCDGHDGDEGGATTTSSDEIVIKTHAVIDIPEGGPQPGNPTGEGEVLDGSVLGDAPFCSGGTFSDLHSDDPEIGLVDRTFDCPDGSLRIGFTPGVPQGRTQAGPWKVVSGTGAFKGLQGHGEMEIEYEPGTRSTEGRETFTGTVVP
jgi:hypothetical protein